MKECKYGGLVHEWGEQEVDRWIGVAVLQTLFQSVVVKRELNTKPKLMIYWSVYMPSLTHGHELLVGKGCFLWSAATERIQSEVDSLVCCGSLSWCRTQVLQARNRWLHILLQDVLADRGIHASIYHSFVLNKCVGSAMTKWGSKTDSDHQTTTTTFDCWYEVPFMKCHVSFMPVVFHRIFFLKLLRFIKTFSLANVRWAFVLFGQHWFSPYNYPILLHLFVES